MRYSSLIRGLFLMLALTLGLAAEMLAASPAQAGVNQRIVQIARQELAKGVREVPDGSNRGTRIRMYGLSTKQRFYPAPWCAYFTSWVARKAGAPIGYGGSGLGYVPYIKNWAKATGKWRSKPQAGNLIMFPQHVGFVEEVYANGTLTTIEGNSSNRIARRWRRWSEASGYVALAKSTSRPKPTTPNKPKPQGGGGNKRSIPLVARITAYPNSTIQLGDQVDFTSNDSSGNVQRSAWDLNSDGSYEVSGDSVSKVFSVPGRHTVKLRVTDARKRKAVAHTEVNVIDPPPIARISLPLDSVLTGDQVHVDGGGSSDNGPIKSYKWDVNNDGQADSTEVSPSFRFSRSGDYKIKLWVTDSAGRTSSAERALKVRKPLAPQPRIECDTYDLPTGQRISCSAARSSSAETQLVEYKWDPNGDGTFELSGEKVSWIYTRPASFKLGLRVIDDRGYSAETSTTINARNRGPKALIHLPTSLLTNTKLNLDGSASEDPDGEISLYEWDLDGNGSFETKGASAAATFANPGSFPVRLRVTDNAGATDTVTATLLVTDPLSKLPTARLTVETASPLVGNWIRFSAAGSSDPDGSISSYEWDFDNDGTLDSTTTGQTAYARYWTAQAYTVKLTVVDNRGNRSSATATVTVR